MGQEKTHACWVNNKRKGRKKKKKEQLLKMLSWKCFRRPLTSNKSSVFLNTEKSLLSSELIPATVTSKNNKAHKNIKVHPLQLGRKKECIQFFRWKTFEVTEFIVMQLALYVGKMKRGKKINTHCSVRLQLSLGKQNTICFWSVHRHTETSHKYLHGILAAAHLNPSQRHECAAPLPCPPGPL